MKQILTATQTTSDETHLSGSLAFVILEGHAGGTWVLQIKGPVTDTWIDTDVDFTGSGIKAFDSNGELLYRLTGGTVGAVASVADGAFYPRSG